MPFKILTFDGGGIGGLFTSVVLDRIAAQFPTLLPSVDLIAGTSTGGIIALGLAANKSPSQLANLYRTHAAEIFDDSLWDNIRDFGNATGADHSNKNLKKVLTNEFGASTLGSLSKRVLVPTFDLDSSPAPGRRTWKPKFFHNVPGSDSDAAESVVDVAMRTSAAPTYFPSYEGYIDGGVVANNPSMAALAAALDPRSGNQNLSNIVLLSFSTGCEDRYIKGDTHNWGWGQWARPLVSIMINGVMGVADFQCKQILDNRYHRVDHVMERTVNLNDARSSTLQYLTNEANSVNLAPTLSWLQTHWS